MLQGPEAQIRNRLRISGTSGEFTIFKLPTVLIDFRQEIDEEPVNSEKNRGAVGSFSGDAPPHSMDPFNSGESSSPRKSFRHVRQIRIRTS